MRESNIMSQETFDKLLSENGKSRILILPRYTTNWSSLLLQSTTACAKNILYIINPNDAYFRFYTCCVPSQLENSGCVSTIFRKAFPESWISQEHFSKVVGIDSVLYLLWDKGIAASSDLEGAIAIALLALKSKK